MPKHSLMLTGRPSRLSFRQVCWRCGRIRWHRIRSRLHGQCPFPQPCDVGQEINWGDFPRKRAGLYDSFFLRSAQRLFIANDKRFLPSGVRPLPRLSPVVAGEWPAATLVFLTGRDEFVAPSSAIARLSRFLSCSKSATILSKSTIHSSPVFHY